MIAANMYSICWPYIGVSDPDANITAKSTVASDKIKEHSCGEAFYITTTGAAVLF